MKRAKQWGVFEWRPDGNYLDSYAVRVYRLKPAALRFAAGYGRMQQVAHRDRPWWRDRYLVRSLQRFGA
jgi:hypothetical protein